jgi:hypothetical protein
MKPRRGTKANPFEIGEQVRIRHSGFEGEVVECRGPAPFRSGWDGRIAYTRIKYLVNFHDRTDWFECHELEAVK